MSKNLLDVLVLIKDYGITKENDCYVIEHRVINLAATIKLNGEVHYYISGCYDSGCDYIEIPISELEKLKVIVQYLLSYEVTNNE